MCFLSVVLSALCFLLCFVARGAYCVACFAYVVLCCVLHVAYGALCVMSGLRCVVCC